VHRQCRTVAVSRDQREQLRADQRAAAAERSPSACSRPAHWRAPGGGADLTPAQLRALAPALLAAAPECEARPMDKKHFARAVGRYPTESAPGGTPGTGAAAG
jgi:hypothetical protein